MMDGSKTRKSLVGVEVQSPYVIERHSTVPMTAFETLPARDFNVSVAV